MADKKFDPYHAWLGIPKWDRPANAYRLLGIEVFEENRSVIEAAANRQMAYLQELSSGDEHIEEAQKLLGQVSKARVVLLNPEKKAAYDKKLSDQLDSLPDATGDGSQSTKIPTHSSAAVTLARKEKSFNRLSVTRIMLFGLVGLLAIVCALLFRTKPLVVRAYIDANQNGFFDTGEEVESVGIVKYFIGPKYEDGGELDTYSWPTDASGIVNFQNIATGLIGFAAENPYEVSGNPDKLYCEVQVNNGPRFFAQVVDIPVVKTDQSAQASPEEEAERKATQDADHKAAEEAERIAKEKESHEKNSDSADKQITVFGQFTTEDRDGQEVGVQVGLTKNETAWLDINGDGVVNQKEVRYYLQTGEDGKFELEPFLPEQDKVPTLSVKKVEGFKPMNPVPIPVEKAKDGQITLEIPPLIRKTITISGTVSTEPATESAEGYLVFMDRNENREPDEGEPSTTTDGEGNYDFTLPFFIEDYPKDGRLSLLIASPPQHNEKLKIEIDRTKKIIWLNSKDWRKGLSGVNFIATNNDVKIAIPENGVPGDDNQASDSGSENLFDPQTESKAFLEHLGFSGDLPEEGSGEKPVWTFQVDDALISQFTTAKRAFDKAAKKQKWSSRIPELERAKRFNNQQIDKIMKGAGNNETARSLALEQTAPYNKENTGIDKELTPLKESRDALLRPFVMAAEAIEQSQQQYQTALDDKERVKIAAENLSVTIRPLAKQQIAAWQPALKFLDERKLERLGLKKQGRKWIPIGVLQEAAMLPKIKAFAQKNFEDYFNKKQRLAVLIRQRNSANQSQIDKLQQQIINQAKYSPYKNAKKEFDRITKLYIEHLSTLQSQRAEIEGNKEAIEKALGGAKKLQAVLKQFPTDKEMDDKRTFITNLQSNVN